VVTQAASTANTAISNTSTAHDTPKRGILTPPRDNEVIIPAPPIPALSISKTANKKSNVRAGEAVTYTYVVTNTGFVSIDNVRVTDEHRGTGTAPTAGNENLTNTSGHSIDTTANNGVIDTLAAGDKVTFTGTYVVTQADIVAGVAITNLATAQGTPKTGILTHPAAHESITPAAPIPAMSITKTANRKSNVAADDTVTYTYVVTNTGNVNINNVSVTDAHNGKGTAPTAKNEVLTNTSGHSINTTPNDGTVNTLAPGDKVTFTGTYVVTQADIDAGIPITNTATANGTPTIGALVPPKANETITPTTGSPALSIAKTADVTSDLKAGETVTYTYIVSNTGNVDIDNVRVTDMHSGTGTAPTAGKEILTNTSGHSINTTANNGVINTLAPGDRVTFTGTYVVTQDDINAATAITNTATAHGKPRTGTLTEPTDNERITTATPIPALDIAKTADKTSNAVAGDTITYTYVVTNIGNVDIDDVTVTDAHNGKGAVPTAGNEVLTNTSGHSINTTANNGVIDTLAPGDRVTFTGTYVVTQADIDAGKPITNTATAHGKPKTGTLTPPAAIETVTPSVGLPTMSINKAADKTSNAVAGDTITYTYVVSNTGNVNIDNVTVTDAHNGKGPAPTAGSEVLTNTSGNSVDTTPNDGTINTLAPGDKATFTGTYVVTQADIDAGAAIINTAKAHGTPKTGTLTAPTDQETVIPVPGVPAMSIEKTADKKSNLNAGDTVTYTYLVTNTGNVDIDNVTVEDKHSGTGTQPVAGGEVLTNTSGLSNDATVNGSIDTLAPGDVAAFTSTYVITQADIDAGTPIINTAKAHGTPRTGTLTAPTDQETVVPTQGVPTMSIKKSADKLSGVAAGETVTYTYVVTNTGNVDIDDVTVADAHNGAGPAPTAGSEILSNTSGHSIDATANDGSIDTLAPGDVVTFTGTYVVTQADVDAATPIINIATVHGTPPPGIGPLAPPSDQEIVTPEGSVPALSIKKTADKTSNVKAGEIIAYTYVVTNIGNIDIDHVTVTDVHSGTGIAPTAKNELLINTSGLSSNTIPNDGVIDTLAPGDIATFVGSYLVTQTDIDAGAAITNVQPLRRPSLLRHLYLQ